MLLILKFKSNYFEDISDKFQESVFPSIDCLFFSFVGLRRRIK